MFFLDLSHITYFRDYKSLWSNLLLFPTVRPLIWATSIEDNDTIEEVEFFRRRPGTNKETSISTYRGS